MSDLASAAEATIKLGFTDSHGGFEQSATTEVYLLKLSDTPALAPARIEAAAERVARKWRLYAGRVHFDKQLDVFVIRAPLGDIPTTHTLVNFTAIELAAPFPTPIALNSPTTCSFISPLQLASLRAPTTEGNLLAIAGKDIALVSIHVATYTDYQQIAFTISHSIVDATAFADYLRAFSAELNGEDWTAPPLERESALDEAVSRILAEQPTDNLDDLVVKDGGFYERGEKESWRTPFRLLGAIAVEKLWYGCEDGGAFIGADVAAWLVAHVKREVAEVTKGDEYVSTGDVLQAWLLKAAYAGEPSDIVPKLASAICLRKLLGLEGRAQHTVLTYFNLHGPCPRTATLAALALSNRRRLQAIKSPLKAAAALAWLQEQNSRLPLFITMGFDSWLLSDQRQTGRPQAVDWGSGKGRKQWFWIKEKTDTKDSSMSLNRLEEGYTWTGVMRRSRWASVRTALASLEDQFRGETGGE